MTTAEQKLQVIAETLRKETLEPAKKEAEGIVAHAEREAEQIIANAHKEAEAIAEKNRAQLENEKQVFETSLQQGAKQAREALRQAVEQSFFRDGLAELLTEQAADPKLVARLIESIAGAIDKAGIEVAIQALIPQACKPEEVTASLSKRTLEMVKDGVTVGDFSGGVQVRLVDRHITLDISDAALADLLGRYVRKDFREKYFRP